MTLRRDILQKYFGEDPSFILALEDQSDRLDEVETVTTANVAATDTIRNATYVTLSANAELPNETVLAFGKGIGFDLIDGQVVIRISANVPYSASGHLINFVTAGDSNLGLPLSGTLATLAGAETLSSKTLSAPKVSEIGDYADDTAAAAAGVPVGGVYRTGSALKVRVT